MSNYSNEAKALKAGSYYGTVEARQVRRSGQQRLYCYGKRAMDILGSTAGILVLFPVFMLIALCLKLEDRKGNVIFKQVRVGKDGKPFHMYKFRSMVYNAEEILQQLLDKNEIDGAMFKMKDDPRITRVGKFIRKTSLDELPQLWNVLRGDMSLVGPRPPLPREVTQYSSHDQQRLTVIPGCTGLWQVSGRNGLSFEEMVELDLYYIKHRSLWMDIKLIIRTVWIIVFPNNAY